MPDDRAEVGILFVHGIGSQRDGETLEAFGGPLVAYAQERLARAGGNLTRTDADEGPGWVVDVRVRGRACRWRMAEAWWAERFDPPAHAELAWWGAVYAPWIIQRDALRYVGRDGRGLLRILLQAAVSLASSGGWAVLQVLRLLGMTVVAAVMQLVLLVSVPFESMLRRLTHLVAESVGDCYMFVAQPAAREAIVSSVSGAIERMGAECETVVVVAHSQGAAVAHQALLRARVTNVTAMVTLGQGLHKLSAAATVARHRAALSVLAVLRVAGVVTAMAVLAVDGPSNPVPWLVLLGLALSAGVGAHRIVRSVRGRVDQLLEHRPGMVWADLWSLPDPVPGGRLPAEQHSGRFASLQVHNEASWLHDHIHYQHNNAQVQAALYGLVMTRAGFRSHDPGEDALEDTLAKDRGRRLLAFWAGRAATVLSIAIWTGSVQAWLQPAAPWSYVLWWVGLFAIADVAWRRAWGEWHAAATRAAARLERCSLFPAGWRTTIPYWYVPGLALVLAPAVLLRSGAGSAETGRWSSATSPSPQVEPRNP